MNDCKEIWCTWINDEFIPCTEMKKHLEEYDINYRFSYKKKKGCRIEIKKCPFCNNNLKDFEKIEKEYRTTRKFQIRNIGRDGCGSFYYVTVPIDTSLSDIKNLILDTLTNEKKKSDCIFYSPYKATFNRKMKIVEIDLRTFNTKRKGQKGYAYLSYIEFKGINILIGKKFDNKNSYFDMIWEDSDE